jgi:RNA recognition motif-containing protein
MNIYVGNLSYKVKEDDLKNVFAEYGEVSAVRIITDKYSGKSKGFGFVTMDNDEEANQAINSLNNHELNERKMVVNEAKPKEDNRPKRF